MLILTVSHKKRNLYDGNNFCCIQNYRLWYWNTPVNYIPGFQYPDTILSVEVEVVASINSL